ncbi:conserved protein of unknown function [Burkholderia multivorans]
MFSPDSIIPAVSTDLIRAWERSDRKIEDWTQDKARQALLRYQRFLMLVAANPGIPHAPTRDIDEMWHLHMLAPKAYHEDCMRLFGEVLDHDGGFGKEENEKAELRVAFERTAQLWLEMYGEPYVTGSSDSMIDCWHDCQGRCWHACKSKAVDGMNG